ncbi:MAG: cysteine-rich CWC family protein [Candidatus Saccharibacteria bacterium]|nr:cysteine-rich CWC family protein [Rhodoferax sp.]
MHASLLPLDPSHCPLCGQPNRCAMEQARSTGQAQPPCWCWSAVMPSATLAGIPAQAINQACICAACAAKIPPA